MANSDSSATLAAPLAPVPSLSPLYFSTVDLAAA